VKLGIKEKRQKKGEEEECIERKVDIGNKWWEIMTIYSKEMKTTRRRVEDAMKENREKEEQEIEKRIGRTWNEDLKTRWRMQRGRHWWNGLKKMDGRHWTRTNKGTAECFE
jgi:hypothetical protein